MPLQWRNRFWQSLEEGAGKRRCSECNALLRYCQREKEDSTLAAKPLKHRNEKWSHYLFNDVWNSHHHVALHLVQQPQGTASSRGSLGPGGRARRKVGVMRLRRCAGRGRGIAPRGLFLDDGGAMRAEGGGGVAAALPAAAVARARVGSECSYKI